MRPPGDRCSNRYAGAVAVALVACCGVWSWHLTCASICISVFGSAAGSVIACTRRIPSGGGSGGHRDVVGGSARTGNRAQHGGRHRHRHSAQRN